MGGTAYIYLKDLRDSSHVKQLIPGLKGVEEVISKAKTHQAWNWKAKL
jgi:hypothetical protein